MASSRLGARLEMSSLRRQHPVSVRGLTFSEMADIAQSMEMVARTVRCELLELKDLALPAVLHWDMRHFVLLERVTGKRIVVSDPAVGRRALTMSEASKHFTGMAMEVSRAPAFRRRKERSPLNIVSMFRVTPGLAAALIQTLILSLLMQLYVLAGPFYMQLAVDEAALKGDRGLLVALAIGFGTFAIFNVVAEALRGVAVQRASALLGWDMTVRLYRHMVRLPLQWFQKRKLADTLIRFESLEPVRQLIANGLITSLIDGLLSLTTLIMMLVFAWPLAVVAVLGFVAFAAIRLGTIQLSIRLASDALTAQISEQGKRIETLRAIQTIKALGSETEREGDWANHYANVIRTRQTSANANVGFRALQGLSDAVAYVVIIYLGGQLIIDGELTVGVLFAFMAYRQQFQQRTTGLFETFVNWRMLDLHSDRLADIALTPVEKGINQPLAGLPALVGALEVENLSFQYAPHEPFVFRNISLNVEAGEFVAFVGPSGSGKTTLLKVLTGLYAPTWGTVRIDGKSLDSWGPKAVRRSLGVVMQDDDLLAGSIAENVAFFAEDIDMERVRESLRMASVLEEIDAMPMHLETLVGDMGSALSGGQKQRILLARALYRRPRILVLDEATSHLDLTRERTINDALGSLAITRLIVAHRPETIAAADRVILIKDGMIAGDRRRETPRTKTASTPAI